jgi:phage replication O-like protein O
MANPQAENGHIDIANEIADALAGIRISGTEYQLIWVILRKTYGWHKKEDQISLSQFHEMTGLPKPHIIRYLKTLLHKKIITVAQNDNGKGNVYVFNKDFDKWVPLPKKITLHKMITSIAQNDNESLPKMVPTKENYTKETIQKKAPFPEWLPEETFFEYLSMRRKIRKPLQDKSFNRFFNALKKLCDETRASPEDILNQSILNSWQGIFPLKENGTQNNYERTAVIS